MKPNCEPRLFTRPSYMTTLVPKTDSSDGHPEPMVRAYWCGGVCGVERVALGRSRSQAMVVGAPTGPRGQLHFDCRERASPKAYPSSVVHFQNVPKASSLLFLVIECEGRRSEPRRSCALVPRSFCFGGLLGSSQYEAQERRRTLRLLSASWFW